MSYTYDADGTLASKTDANNNTETYTYDTYQRLTAIPDRQQTFTYDTAPRAPSDATAYGFCRAPDPKVAGRLNATLKPKLTTSLRAAGRGPREMVENWLRCFVVSTSRATNHARRARSARRRPPRAGSPHGNPDQLRLRLRLNRWAITATTPTPPRTEVATSPLPRWTAWLAPPAYRPAQQHAPEVETAYAPARARIG